LVVDLLFILYLNPYLDEGSNPHLVEGKCYFIPIPSFINDDRLIFYSFLLFMVIYMTENLKIECTYAWV